MPDVNSPQFGIGLAALGRPGYINLGHAEDLERDYTIDAMEQRAYRVLDAAWQAGVRYFDAARSYGRAEAFLGSWIRDRNIASGDITVGSKWGYTYTADWKVQTPESVAHEVKRHELDVLQRQYVESLGELGEHQEAGVGPKRRAHAIQVGRGRAGSERSESDRARGRRARRRAPARE